MAMLLFKLDQLFLLLVPELVNVDISFPSKPKVFQKSLLIKSNFVLVMTGPLRVDPWR
jgi:hypothetical protein